MISPVLSEYLPQTHSRRVKCWVIDLALCRQSEEVRLIESAPRDSCSKRSLSARQGQLRSRFAEKYSKISDSICKRDGPLLPLCCGRLFLPMLYALKGIWSRVRPGPLPGACTATGDQCYHASRECTTAVMISVQGAEHGNSASMQGLCQ